MDNVNSVTQTLKAQVPPERLAKKISEAALGSIVVLVGLSGLGFIIYTTFTALQHGTQISTLLVIVGIGVSLCVALFGANIISFELTKTALKIIVAFVQDILSAVKGYIPGLNSNESPK